LPTRCRFSFSQSHYATAALRRQATLLPPRHYADSRHIELSEKPFSPLISRRFIAEAADMQRQAPGHY